MGDYYLELESKCYQIADFINKLIKAWQFCKQVSIYFTFSCSRGTRFLIRKIFYKKMSLKNPKTLQKC